jgi:hypothetical protein
MSNELKKHYYVKSDNYFFFLTDQEEYCWLEEQDEATVFDMDDAMTLGRMIKKYNPKAKITLCVQEMIEITLQEGE